MTVAKELPENKPRGISKTVAKMLLLILGAVLTIVGVYTLVSTTRSDMEIAKAAVLMNDPELSLVTRLHYMLYVIGTPLFIVGLVMLIGSLFVPSAETEKVYGSGSRYWKRLGADLIRDKWLYLLLLPGLVYFVIFKYLPMWGIVISFENYVPYSGVFGSEWVGLKWFKYFFSVKSWSKYLMNTLILSFMNIVFYFPAPIILALLLNEVRSTRYKKLVQTFLYVPHFISIVIVVSITLVMFSSTGIVYKLTEQIVGHPVKYMTDPNLFRAMIIGQTIWKETGWGTIIFLAALTNVDTQLYEAAMVDGAGRLRRLWHITLPAIRSTIVLMLILRMGSMLDTGYDHLILMANPLNRSASQTLDVFVYQQGLQQAQYSYASAVGLMKSVISVIMVVTSNKIAHLLGEQGLY